MTSSLPDDRWVLRAPRLNANDDSVTLTRWLAADRATVAAGAPIAEIETEKPTAELAAERGGTLLQAAPAGTKVPIGAPLAYVAATLAVAEELRHSHAQAGVSSERPQQTATAKARVLAAARGVDLGGVRASGATIKEQDIARHVAERGVAREALATDPR